MSEHEGDFATIIDDQARRLFEDMASNSGSDTFAPGEIDHAAWQRIEEAGLPLAMLDEAAGGIGLSPVASFALINASAYYGLALPIGETMLFQVLAGTAHSGVATFAVTDAPGKASVPFARHAGHVLVDENGAWSIHEAADIECRGALNLADEPRDDITLLGEGQRIARPAWLAPGGVREVGALLRATQMSGAMHRVLDMSIAHVSERSQFGRPIAKFQAIQHLLADAAGQVAAASAICESAAEAWGRTDFAFRAALAKARVGSAATLVAAIGHQVHGAMGFTREHRLHVFTRRLWSWRDEFGDEAYWNEIIGTKACEGGGAGLWPLIVEATNGDVR